MPIRPTTNNDDAEIKRACRQAGRMWIIKNMMAEYAKGREKNDDMNDDDTAVTATDDMTEVTTSDASSSFDLRYTPSSVQPVAVKHVRFEIDVASPQNKLNTDLESPFYDEDRSKSLFTEYQADPSEEVAQGLEEPGAVENYAEALNDWFTSCFNCTYLYLPRVPSVASKGI